MVEITRSKLILVVCSVFFVFLFLSVCSGRVFVFGCLCVCVFLWLCVCVFFWLCCCVFCVCVVDHVSHLSGNAGKKKLCVLCLSVCVVYLNFCVFAFLCSCFSCFFVFRLVFWLCLFLVFLCLCGFAFLFLSVCVFVFCERPSRSRSWEAPLRHSPL